MPLWPLPSLVHHRSGDVLQVHARPGLPCEPITTRPSGALASTWTASPSPKARTLNANSGRLRRQPKGGWEYTVLGNSVFEAWVIPDLWIPPPLDIGKPMPW
jgi:hypothetical protein